MKAPPTRYRRPPAAAEMRSISVIRRSAPLPSSVSRRGSPNMRYYNLYNDTDGRQYKFYYYTIDPNDTAHPPITNNRVYDIHFLRQIMGVINPMYQYAQSAA